MGKYYARTQIVTQKATNRVRLLEYKSYLSMFIAVVLCTLPGERVGSNKLNVKMEMMNRYWITCESKTMPNKQLACLICPAADSERFLQNDLMSCTDVL